MLLKLLVSLSGSFGAYLCFQLVKFIRREYWSSIRYIPGPKASHLFFGNIKDIGKEEHSVVQEQWLKEYGPTIKYREYFGASRLYSTDPKALNHFLTHDSIYQKPAALQYTLARILGKGLLIAEGEDHKKQRRIMNPAFGPAQVRGLTDLFWGKSLELRDVWDSEIDRSQSGVAQVDALSWTGRATLDIIGLAGFNYQFNALHSSTEESQLGQAMSSIFFGLNRGHILRILQLRFPIFRIFRTKLDLKMDAAQATMQRIARQLLQESKNDMAANGTFAPEGSSRARDLLSLLVRANTAKDLPEGQRLSDDDVIAQIPTFFLAGHETTSTATTWALFALTQNQDAQKRLRKELLAVPSDTLSMDELNALPYLDCVVREALRIHSPAPSTLRVATQDDVVPLARPFKDVNGVLRETLEVRKGQTIVIPILAMNRSEEIWGPDAREFIPERWEGEKISNSIPGVWGHMLTFLGGPRACIGYRFSLIEMKCLLFVLIRAFEFELAVPREDIGKKQGIVSRPFVKSLKAPQMPLLVKRISEKRS
ncbi:cytochrome P450 [Mycena amicta]|nr:cytochrome P450 [Mycena amicta]